MGFEFPVDLCDCISSSSPLGCTHRLNLLSLLDIASFISESRHFFTLHADNCYRYSLLILQMASQSITNAKKLHQSEYIKEQPLTVQGKFHQVFPSIALSDEETESLFKEYQAHKATQNKEASQLDCSIS